MLCQNEVSQGFANQSAEITDSVLELQVDTFWFVFSFNSPWLEFVWAAARDIPHIWRIWTYSWGGCMKSHHQYKGTLANSSFRGTSTKCWVLYFRSIFKKTWDDLLLVRVQGESSWNKSGFQKIEVSWATFRFFGDNKTELFKKRSSLKGAEKKQYHPEN